MAMTVTATQGGTTSNGLVLRVYVLTGAAAAASQSGGSFNTNFASATTWTGSITTSAGSNVYGGASAGNSGPVLTGSNATVVDNVPDTGNVESYITFKALNVTSGATARGFTSTAQMSGPFTMLEILASGTLAEDSSAPAVVSTTAATTLTTASFTPPGGSLLVAVIGSDGGAAVTTYTVSGGGLTWSEKVKNNPSGGDYAGVWIADGPAGAAPSPVLIRGAVQYAKPPPSPPGKILPGLIYTPAAAMSGAGTLTAAPYFDPSPVTMTGLGTLTAAPGVGSFPVLIRGTVQYAPASKALPSQVITGPAAAFAGAATLSGLGTLSAAYTVTGGAPIPAVIRGPVPPPPPPQQAASQILGAAPIVTYTEGAALSGLGTLTAAPYFDPSPVTLSGSGTLTASAGVGTFPVVIRGAVQYAKPPPSPPARIFTGAATAFAGAATLTGLGTLSAAPVFAETAALSGAGTLTAAPAFTPAPTLTGLGTLTNVSVSLGIGLTGTGTLTAAYSLAGAGAAALTGIGTLSTVPPFAVARSTSSVTDPRDGTPSVTAVATSTPGVT